jgi:hypothetical protein
MTSRKTVTRSEYLQVEGLLALARNHSRHLADIERALAELLDDSGIGHVTDAIYDGDGRSATDLLDRMEIDVEQG